MVDLKLPASSSSTTSSSSCQTMGWKMIQFSCLALLLCNLCRNQSHRLQPTTARAKTSSLRTTTSTSSTSQYTRPVSERVPREGIETVLATSSTDPSFHFFAHSRAKDFTTSRIVSTGIYEGDSTTRLVDAIVCDDKMTKNNHNQNQQHHHHYVAVDLGANIGFHSLHMASCGASVISFEASPDTAWLLRSSALLNGFLRDKPSSDKSSSGSSSLTLIPMGVSNVTSTGRLERHEKSPGMTTFVQQTSDHFKPKMQSDHPKGSALDVDIPLVRAQDVLRDLGVSPQAHHLRLLKIDVEGLEYQALQGLDLKQYPFDYITLEFFPALLAASGSGVDPAELLVYIWKHGYRFLAFSGAAKGLPLDRYPYLDTGTREDAVRTWAQHLVEAGQKQQGEDYHTNLLAKLVK